LLFFRASDGYAVTGAVGSNGGFTQLQIIKGLSASWTAVTAVGGGRLLFYRSSDGQTATGVVDSRGTFTSLKVVAGLSAGWSQITES
jgi:hypothetical protein